MSHRSPLDSLLGLAHHKLGRAVPLMSAVCLSIMGCAPGGEGEEDPIVIVDPPVTPPVIIEEPIQPTPPKGQTDFWSADARNGQRSQDNAENNADSDFAAAPGAEADNESERRAEEGDIYRVVQDGQQGLILNLNAYRGFQIIDFSNVTNPQVIGRVPLSGTPVEMYQVGDRVFVLLNNWYSYWSSRHAPTSASQHHGGGVVVIDISDTTQPKIESQAPVDGWIRTSRLTRGGGKEALYVVSNEYQGGGQTHVRSFGVSGQGALSQASSLSLGGYVQDIQATGERLLVSRYDYSNGRNHGSDISIIDISSPDGAMVEGQSVQVKGMVDNKHNMNLDGDILRIVSSNSWSSATNTNHVQTFDASDVQHLVPIDEATFGDGEQLYATLFLDEKAFFVTYLRVDPFHAFSISPTGQITEESEFVVSGWNDYFRDVVGRARLIGIGKNDENGRNTMAVSLYDITDLKNPNPLITRAEVALDHSWSEAQWDDRAFSVLEKATSVTAPDGVTTESGLVLLPFSGWNEQEKRYVSAVQIYTFSRDTLTLRGTMEHGSHVRRSFMADAQDKTTANLSELELSLFDTSDPDAPSEKGRIELAPNYTSLKLVGKSGQFAVRTHDRSAYYGWWGQRSDTAREDSLQVIALNGQDPDRAPAVAEITVPANAQTYVVDNDKLVAVSQTVDYEHKVGDEPLVLSEVQVWDLSDPTKPSLLANMMSDKLPRGHNYYGGWYGEDCWECGYWGGSSAPAATVVGDALVFPERTSQERLEGTLHQRVIRPHREMYAYRRDCYDHESNDYAPQACTFQQGSIRCSQLTRVDGAVEPEVCQGSIKQCVQDALGHRECTEIDPMDSSLERRTYDPRNQYRRWSSAALHVLDLSVPSQPSLGQPVALPTDEEFVGIVADGSTLYASVKQPYDLPGDSRPYVRHYVRPLALHTPSAPALGAPVNVPGSLLFAEGPTLVTQDALWGATIVEASLNQLTLHDGKAHLDHAPIRFTDQQVDRVEFDAHSRQLVVGHQTGWIVNYEDNHGQWEDYDRVHHMSVVEMNAQGLTKLSEVEVDEWGSLQSVVASRALFQVPGGLLVFNLDDPSAPTPQSYFPAQGWPQDILIHDGHIMMATGRYGIYSFGIHEANLYQGE